MNQNIKSTFFSEKKSHESFETESQNNFSTETFRLPKNKTITKIELSTIFHTTAPCQF